MFETDRYLSPFERRERGRRRLIALAGITLLALAGLLVFTLVDRSLYLSLRCSEIPNRDWYRLLRVLGYLPTWILISALVVAVRRAGPRAASAVLGWLPAVAAALSGAGAEILKLIFARERPTAEGAYVFRPLFSGFRDGSGLGLPSSHAAVAFGGAFMLARLHPATRGPALLLAAGCGLTRLIAGAHFASDVFVAGVVGWAVSLLLAPRERPARTLP